MNVFWNILNLFRKDDTMIHKPNYRGNWVSNKHHTICGEVSIYIPESYFKKESHYEEGELLIHYDKGSPYKGGWNVWFPICKTETLGSNIFISDLFEEERAPLRRRNKDTVLILSTKDQNMRYEIKNPQTLTSDAMSIDGKYYSVSPSDEGTFIVHKTK